MVESPPRSGGLIDRLLRGPSQLFGPDAGRAVSLKALLGLTVAGYALYGLVIGSFAGGSQWWAAPLKAVGGTLICGAICLPSLYIFATLCDAALEPQQVIRLMLAQSALAALLLAGFAPVAWVFSQSSRTASFIGAIHVVIWIVSLLFSQRLVRGSVELWGATKTGLVALWSALFLVTSLQMSSALRPWVGATSQLLPEEKRFFLQHWGEAIVDDLRHTPASD